jgi:peptide/nickel transport system substrate-binding protein
MKNNFFGYIFILFIIVIMGFAIYRVKVQNGDKNAANGSESTSSTQEIEKGKEITLGISEFDNINPIITSNKKVQDIDRLIYEPLINITEDYNIEYTLAQECAKNSNNIYIIKLRQGVKWSDGSKFTSDDVKYTIDKLKENENSVYAQNVSQIKEVDIIDNYTLRVILSQDVNNFEYYLNFPILSSSYYLDTDFWNTDKNKAPITTGQYKISEVTNNTIVLGKNSNWWNSKKDTTIIDKITINLYSTAAELYNAFKMGSIDLISTENGSYQDYIGTIGYDVSEIEGREFIFLALNTQSGILSDANVRKAIRASLDKNRIISNSYGNMYKQTNFPLNTGSYLIEKQDENFYNIDEKNNLLTSSGWELKNGIWQKIENYRAKAIELNLVVRASDGTRCRAAEDIKNQLQDQGFVINIIYADDNSYNSYLNNMNYDMMLGNIKQPIAPDLTTYFGYNNLAKYENQEVNDIMNVVKNSTDSNELKSKYQRLYELYNDEVPYIGIARNKIIAVKNTELVGDIKANWYSMFYNIKEWYTSK